MGETVTGHLRMQEELPGGWTVSVWRELFGASDTATHVVIDGHDFCDLPPAGARQLAETLLAAAARAEQLHVEFDRRVASMLAGNASETT
jgi:hypothetical protein